ncbi:DUF86 domain-containing protein [Geodermatophilus sp. DF01-2]|uniref:type VII toxin-antitoxin system HepT family RNase toxin n=1 Tax=Geodermatophilus sp. DF01-2 TaxID=2559610 RepID=UPI0010749865|nr:DUF86 domain-containing protein [Geodermatophilus sp. DF01_2]TFV63552.1 DUF86 domain-containing protein [Geodermatophilus sp. DF01_2]
MVDAERLGRLLARVRKDVERIRRTSATHDLVHDPIALDAVKYGFVTAIEGCVRAAQHLVASEGLGMPESNAAAVRLLGRHGVVPADVAEQVARAVGFRNVLVHEYAEVDDDVVRANVALLDDLDEFTSTVAAWAARNG